MITLQQIAQFLWDVGPSKIGAICEFYDSNRVSIGKILKLWVELWYIQKTWKAPHSYYSITDLAKTHFGLTQTQNIWKESTILLEYSDRKLLDSFYKFESNGKVLSWAEGFVKRCQNPKRNIDPYEAAKRYIQIIHSIENRKNACGLIDVTKEFIQGSKQKHKQSKIFIDRMYYCDRNNYDEFGRGPLAEQAFFAKTSSNMHLNKKVIQEVLPFIDCLIHKQKIDAIAITPWSINRKVQLLWVLRKALSIYHIPFIPLEKYFPHNIPIAQKSLKWDQRFVNAESSLQINMQAIQKVPKKYHTILLIDDFVGSGATMNISAKKIKQLQLTENIIWLAFVGNIDMSYEVISEI